jgi:hypothetical protein
MGNKPQNFAEIRKFSYRKKNINLSKQIPNWISNHPLLAISFEAVTNGGK